MRRYILTAIVAAISGSAFAADLPVITKASILGYPSKCGFYFGVDAEAGAGTVVAAPAGTVMVGGDIGGLVGYACNISSIPYFLEVIGDFQNLNAGSAGFSLSGPAHIEERAGVQVPLLQFLPVLGFPSFGTPPNLPVLPPGVTVTGTPASYVYAAADQDDISTQVGAASARAWLVSPELGIGLLTPLKLSNGWNAVADTWAGVELQTSAVCVGATGMCPKLGTRYKTGVSFKF